MIKPGGTIGILGGGQLGRMLAMAAAQLGYRCIGYAPPGDNVASEVCVDFFANAWKDHAALAAFSAQCDVVTWEFENVPLAAVNTIAPELLASHPFALETAQDRLLEKRFAEQLGGTAAPYRPVNGQAELAEAVDHIGVPGILKTRRDGYDGKGQWRIAAAHDVDSIRVPDVDILYEGFVTFDAEFSVILVRGSDGEIRFWDSAENCHEGGILVRSALPANDLITAQVEEARNLARQTAEALNYVGVLTLEFFATPSGPVFNEMAPRVHNSGHWTIEGATTSQFENHIRAICGLPLGDCTTAGAAVEMRNLIGKQAHDGPDILQDPRTHLHLYGKAKVREGRKMGHLTRVTR